MSQKSQSQTCIQGVKTTQYSTPKELGPQGHSSRNKIKNEKF